MPNEGYSQRREQGPTFQYLKLLKLLLQTDLAKNLDQKIGNLGNQQINQLSHAGSYPFNNDRDALAPANTCRRQPVLPSAPF